MDQQGLDRYFEQRFVVTFQDTNVAGNVYFATYFRWQGVCRELFLASLYPEAREHLRMGSGFATKCAHMDFAHEAFLFETIVVRMREHKLSRIQIEFHFEFIKEQGLTVAARGSQSVVWTTSDHSPGRMPQELYEVTARYLGLTEHGGSNQ